jgi:hypothetical protein
MKKTGLAFTTLITTALILGGCAERGYQLTVQPATHTATAEQSDDLRSNMSESSIKETFAKMKRAVKKALTQGASSTPLSEKIRQSPVAQTPKKKTAATKKEIQKTKNTLTKTKESPTVKQEKINEEKKKQEVAAKEALQESEQKQAQALKAEAEKKKALEAERIAQEKAAQKQKESLLQKKTVAQLKKEREREEKEKQALAAKKRQQQEAEEAIKAKKLKDALLKAETKKAEAVQKTTEKDFSSPITFVHLNKTYQKFGTSEIHGHVIFLSPTGEELPIQNAKAYLLPVGANLNFWYQNFYLKNKDLGMKKIQAHYLNKTSLDLDRNFAFYGVPAGNYYIIIEASHPFAKSKKIYIAKKLHVDKYKKVMAVFSKKL